MNMAAIDFLTKHSIFILIIGLCTIAGLVVGILALVPSTRKKYSTRKRIKSDEQIVFGNKNIVAGGNINARQPNENKPITQNIKTGQQVVVGNNNKVSGGDING
jgi:hypothetical protein